VAWTGGVISFSNWRYFQGAGKPSSFSVRRRRPIAALLKKEFQMHSITLFCAGALLVLHLGIFFMRIFYVTAHRNSFADGVSDFFWMLWLVLPLTLGCMTVAEERKLGVMDGQFCLPASRRLQFVIKFIPAMIFGVLLGGIMPVLLEGLAAHSVRPMICSSRTKTMAPESLICKSQLLSCRRVCRWPRSLPRRLREIFYTH
jgi:ABC-type dipeptide/oligopeptide/nickel transport system permease component